MARLARKWLTCCLSDELWWCGAPSPALPHFAICRRLRTPLSVIPLPAIESSTMLDQLKTVIIRPFADKQTSSASSSPTGKSSEKRFGSAAALSVNEGKNDLSTAFERSGWVYI